MIERDLTQEDVARACGMERKAIQRILSGQVKKPHISTIKRLSEYLIVSPMELTENKTTISRRKLLKFMLKMYGTYSWCDYFIFGKAEKLENSDLRTLINGYGLSLPDVAKEPGEPEFIRFDEVKLLLHVVYNPVDISKVYMHKNLALRSMGDFIQCSHLYLRCRPLQAWELLEGEEKTDRIYIWKRALEYYASNRGLNIENEIFQGLPDLPEGYLKNMMGRPLEGETDAKVVRLISDALDVKPNSILCPKYLL